ncbi:MAG TPA: hypothetical protein EYP24_04415 [bacterium (Candidatus Stahlbacteria)]|nr:hypothetical protein [Candidatus Stahlbacteria bacterium]
MRIFILLLPAVLLGRGLNFGLVFGGNYQWYDLDIETQEAGDGMGFHAGLFIDKSISPSRFLVHLSSELDISFYYHSYSWVVAQVGTASFLKEIDINSIYLPLLLKLNVNTLPFGINLGIGGYLLKNLSGNSKWKSGRFIIQQDLEANRLETDLGLIFRISGRTRLAPLLYLYPCFAFRYNLTPDENYAGNSGPDESEYGIEFGINLGFSL